MWKQASIRNEHDNYKKRVTFNFNSPLVRKIANVFRDTLWHKTCRRTNTTGYFMRDSNKLFLHLNIMASIGWNALLKPCIFRTHWKESNNSFQWIFHIHQKTINSRSVYALRILQNRREYGTVHSTVELMKLCEKKLKLYCCEIYI